MDKGIVENTTKSLWVKLSVGYFDDERILEAGVEAELLFVRGLAWAKRDNVGRISRGAMIRLGLGLSEPDKAADRLVELGLWLATDDGYAIANWTNWQVDAELIQRRKEASALGNHRRWHKQQPIAGCCWCEQDMDDHRKSIASATDLRIQEKEKETEKDNNNSAEDGFSEFWVCYPRKVAKPDALKAWKQVRKQRPPLQDLIGLLEKQKLVWKGTDAKFIPHPATWLRQHRWADNQPVEPSHSVPVRDESLDRAMGKVIPYVHMGASLSDVETMLTEFPEGIRAEVLRVFHHIRKDA